jgi:hypothetical protein
MTTAKFERGFQNPSLWLAGFILIICILGSNVFRDVDASADYVVITSPKSLDTIPYSQRDVVFSVGRSGSPFGVVILVSHTK